MRFVITSMMLALFSFVTCEASAAPMHDVSEPFEDYQELMDAFPSVGFVGSSFDDDWRFSDPLSDPRNAGLFRQPAEEKKFLARGSGLTVRDSGAPWMDYEPYGRPYGNIGHSAWIEGLVEQQTEFYASAAINAGVTALFSTGVLTLGWLRRRAAKRKREEDALFNFNA